MKESDRVRGMLIVSVIEQSGVILVERLFSTLSIEESSTPLGAFGRWHKERVLLCIVMWRTLVR